jgi:hypothetical protein
LCDDALVDGAAGAAAYDHDSEIEQNDRKRKNR